MSYTGPGVLHADSNAISVKVAAPLHKLGDGLETTAWASISISKVQPFNIAAPSDPSLNIARQNQTLCNLANNKPRPKMFILKWLLIAVVVLVIAAILAGQFGLLKGQPPTDLGVRSGQLKAPSNTNNSVSSQAALHLNSPMRAKAEIAALPMVGDTATTMARLQTVVVAMPGAQIVKAEPTYLYAQFTTRLMKYVDDVEFSIDEPAKLIHVRSASRLGKEDFNANRDRIEAIRAKLASAP
jgi:uncharacterized protein (DUF1499 family)